MDKCYHHSDISPLSLSVKDGQMLPPFRYFTFIIIGQRWTDVTTIQIFHLYHYRSKMDRCYHHSEILPLSLSVKDGQMLPPFRDFTFIIIGHRWTDVTTIQRFYLYHYRSKMDRCYHHSEILPLSLSVKDGQMLPPFRDFTFIIIGQRWTNVTTIQRRLQYNSTSESVSSFIGTCPFGPLCYLTIHGN
ncbi:unnamed protein product [Mytilus edulis]|uniref:Uncharacterized protein n=1 Tax=Mytilus edulis TaxID=6550 RepID=A0A8S3PX80_MYTED|nr:unnamed protein product [Mytilus edulis]